ncbi:MAG: tyrosine-type recombinase/integrase [Terriglobales bacterium]
MGISICSCRVGTFGNCAEAIRERAKRIAGLPEPVVLYRARHRFSTDAMEGTGNLIAVMDAMGHEKIDTTRRYNHPGTKQIRDAIERRNQLVQ